MNAPNKSGWKPSAPLAGDTESATFTGNRALMLEEPLIFEIGHIETTGVDLPEPQADAPSRLGGLERTDTIGLPGLSEPECVRHYTRLSRQNYAIDLGLFTAALGATLGQTAVSGKLPVFNGRFDRFATNVLGDAYSDYRRVQLQTELDTLIATLAENLSAVDVVEGFARLDALNRIGNQVFAIDNHRFENYVPINAPVNYPHIWTSPWFDWVQYDGSIMGATHS